MIDNLVKADCMAGVNNARLDILDYAYNKSFQHANSPKTTAESCGISMLVAPSKETYLNVKVAPLARQHFATHQEQVMKAYDMTVLLVRNQVLNKASLPAHLLQQRLPTNDCKILNVDSGEIKIYVGEEETAKIPPHKPLLHKRKRPRKLAS